jgi:hypothetical protein
MYYGNCTAANTSTTSVWSSNFDAVYRLHNDFGDATPNARTATNSGSIDASPALIGDGQSFVNVGPPGDYIQAPATSISAASGTMSIWANASSFSANHQYLFGHTTTPAYANRIQLYVNDATGLLDLGLGDNHDRAVNIFDLNPGQWYYIVLTWNGTNYAVYVNGAAAATGAYTGLSSVHTFLDIGNDGSAAARNETWIGSLDHARLSNDVFSADWIQTEYNNQRASSTFYAVGSEFRTTVTYYSRVSGAWDSNNSWSLSSDGSTGAVPAGVWPKRVDNVVIRSGHSISVNATNDNKNCGVSPANLGLANVGAFTGSGDLMFYHTGDMLISSGATFTATEEVMLAGYTLVETGGTFQMNEDIVNLGYFEISTGATFDLTDDLVISGNSVTIMNNTTTGDDDIYIDHTNATLCGDGILSLGNGGADPTVQFWNGATAAQICSVLPITCTSNCGGFSSGPPSGNFFSGYTGPGGIGSRSVNQLWLMANAGAFSDAGTTSATDNSTIQQWNDQSGNNRHASEATNRPTFRANIINGLPVVRFDGTDRLLSPGITTGNSATVYAVVQYTSLPSANPGIVQGSPSGMGFGGTKTLGMWVSTTGNPWGRAIQSNGTTVNIPQVNGTSASTFYAISNIMNAAAGTVSQYINHAISGSVAYNGTLGSWTDFGVGRQATESWNGDIPEVAVYNVAINTAQRLIISNYLSAKYATALAGANDVYTMDNGGNGSFDYDVAGIGQASDGTNHRDARGSGIVRMWNPNGLGNGEFLMWGHDGSALTGTTADVDGALIEQRFTRIWRVSESGDVGTVSVSFNFNGIGTPLGSNLRLLIDRDGDGFADNDVTPVAGSVSASVATFSNINFQNGDRFTLGNTDASVPLPVQLLAFSAVPWNGTVKLSWRTASELNNDFFTVERSNDGHEWSALASIKGQGTTSVSHDYELVDDGPFPGNTYYRLKQTDLDGQFTFSKVIRIVMDQVENIVVHPNPATGAFVIHSNRLLRPDQITMFDMKGRRVQAEISNRNEGLSVKTDQLAQGLYLIMVNEGARISSLRVLIR